MAVEIERKFLVIKDSWRENAMGIRFRQGYLSASPDCTVRVRIEGDIGKLTVKGKSEGISRLEYEYGIPVDEAQELLDSLCQKPLIEKARYRVDHAGHLWEIDEFYGANDGLVLAELELDAEDAQFELPDWVGQEVSDDPRYYNANLVKEPFSGW